MAKKLEQKEDVIVTAEFEPAKQGTALSIVYNGNKKYSVVAIKFNNTGTSNPSVIESGLDLYEAQHVFKRETIKAGLFDEGLDKV